ncbi:MAG: tetratricopeptide repeat protein [Bacteroidota bacterium]
MRNNIFHILIISAITLLGGFSAHAQKKEALSFDQVNLQTYVYYENGQWDSLILLGERAIADSIDYFYLRTRLGISYYNKGKYRKAIPHFEKALTYNSSDETTLNYLYYSYLYGGRVADANLLLRKFSSSQLKTLGRKKFELITGGLYEGGFASNNNLYNNAALDIDGMENICGMQDLNDNYSFSTLFLRHKISNRITINQGFTILNVNKTKRLIASYLPVPIVYNTKYNVIQKEYYINAGISLGRGWQAIPAFHLLNTQYNIWNAKFDVNSGTVSIKPGDTSFNNYASSLSFTKEVRNHAFELTVTKSNLNGRQQSQFGGAFTLYPFSNLNFYSRTQLMIQTINVTTGAPSSPIFKTAAGPLGPGGPGSQQQFTKTRFRNAIIEEMIGVKITKFLWAEAFVTYGDMIDYVEKNAYVVYNLNDKITKRVGGSLIFIISPALDFSIRTSYSWCDSFYIKYVPNTEAGNFKPVPTITNYTQFQITGGLQWKL